jgi:hypothetical protein
VKRFVEGRDRAQLMLKAVNNRDKNYTMTKVKKRMEQVGASIDRYLAALDRVYLDELRNDYSVEFSAIVVSK